MAHLLTSILYYAHKVSDANIVTSKTFSISKSNACFDPCDNTMASPFDAPLRLHTSA